LAIQHEWSVVTPQNPVTTQDKSNIRTSGHASMRSSKIRTHDPSTPATEGSKRHRYISRYLAYETLGCLWNHKQESKGGSDDSRMRKVAHRLWYRLQCTELCFLSTVIRCMNIWNMGLWIQNTAKWFQLLRINETFPNYVSEQYYSYKLNIIHSVHFIYIFTVRQNVQFNHINCVISLSYMFRTLNLGSSSGTHHLKSHTFTPTGTIVLIVKHQFFTIVRFSPFICFKQCIRTIVKNWCFTM
jgi:hypothetical protein